MYREAAAASIRHDRSLMLLSSLTGESSIENLPSWVPDWSNNDVISEIAEWDEKRTLGQDRWNGRILDDDTRLETDGRIIDTICRIFSKYPEHYSLRTLADQKATYSARKKEVAVLKSWFTACTEVEIIAFFADFARDAWRHRNDESVLDCVALAAHWVKAIKLLRPEASAEYDLPKCLPVVLSKSKLDHATKKSIKKYIVPFHNSIRRLLDRKRLFRTRNGSLGIGCRALKTGDKIALLRGCSLPMIIREAEYEADWRFVCPIYLEGAMHGCPAWKTENSLEMLAFV